MAVAFTKVNDFVEHVAEKVHNLGADALTLALSNTAPNAEISDPTADGNGILGNVTEIASYADCSSRILQSVTSAQTSGKYKLDAADITLTSSGTVGPFQYVYLYNDTATVAIDALLGVYNYGSALTLANTETLDITFDATNGILTNE